jgi:hypothetical protein
MLILAAQRYQIWGKSVQNAFTLMNEQGIGIDMSPEEDLHLHIIRPEEVQGTHVSIHQDEWIHTENRI